MDISSRKGMMVPAVAGNCMKLKNTQKVNQVLMAEIMFWAVPLVNLCAWDTLFLALSWPRKTENKSNHQGAVS